MAEEMQGDDALGRGGGGGGGGSSGEKIFVSVRLRPLNDRESVKNDVSDWECINKNTIVFKHSIPERSMFPVAYTFDRVFGDEIHTREVYLEGAKDVALSVLNGINSTIFAYGQTSSGKTYTMSGVTEYAVSDIYDYIEKHEEREFVLKFSAIEIYNEAVRDLLSNDYTPLRLLDDPERGTVVERLTEETLLDKVHLEELLSICEAQRQIGETSLNETSSRSHQILRLTVESSARDYAGAQNSSTLTASVNFVDLAGSERASQTQSAGTRLKEGCHINRSLLTLGTVIRKLSKGKNGQHVPYRDSKLTRILQNSIGGNGRTAIICTMSPARSHIEQSKNTLLFACCAKEVQTNAQVNLVRSDKALVKQLKRELARLENEMKNMGSSTGRGDPAALLKEKEIQIEQMAKEIKELTLQRDLAQSRAESLLRSVEEVQLTGDPLSLVKARRLAAFNQLRNNDEPNTPGLNQYIENSDNLDDDFLLDDSTPKFVGPDPCEGWEELSRRNDAEPEDLCKEVQCIEVESNKRNTTASDSYPAPGERKTLAMEEGIIKKTEADENNEIQTHEEKKEAKSVTGSPLSEKAVSAQQKEDEEHSPALSVIEDSVPYTQKGNASGPMNIDESYDALRRRVQELQRTINLLISFQAVEQSPPSSEGSYSSSNRSFTRSRSCKSALSTCSASSHSTPATVSERNFHERRAFSQSLSGLRFESSNPSRRESHGWASLDAESMKGSEIDDIPSIYDYVPEQHGRSKLPPRHRTLSIDSSKFSVEDMEAEEDEEEEEHLDDSVRKRTSVSQDFGRRSETKSRSKKQSGDELVQVTAGKETTETASLSEFEIQRRKIIDLWDACYVSLIHRTYFFLLFKGDPSDAVYMEVELRRLSFIKNSFPSGPKNDRNVTIASSMKDLNRERTMLSRQIQKKYSRKEREELYKSWGIALNTKQRALQLARRLWIDTKDLQQIKESAALVAKLIGYVEPSQAPKEVFGLSFSPRNVSRRTFSWRK